jgi:hypothetical protein
MPTKPATLLVCAAFSAVVLTGCSSVRSDTSAPAATATASPAAGRTLPDTLAAEASAEAVRHFNVVVSVSGSGPAEAVRQAVEGRLAAAGYKLSADAPDIIVQLAVRSSEFDRAGDYLRYEGTVETGVKRAWDDKRLGFDTVSVRGKRGLGTDEAMRQLASELSEGVAAQVMKFAKPDQSGLAVQDLTARRPWLTEPDAGFSQRFVGAVRKIPGVMYCAMIAGDPDTRTQVFRVVYLADAVPGGLLNRVSNLETIKIKPAAK